MKFKKNQIILTTNHKGGVGKTQICATAATLFVQNNIPVIVIDADIQQSLSRHRARDLKAHPNTNTPWQCVFLNTTDIKAVEAMIAKIKKLPYTILIDCPGNINDPALNLLFEAADAAIVPFELNDDSVDATVIFAKLIKQHFKLDMVFVPNKVSSRFWKRGEVRKAREDAMEQLHKKLGLVGADIKYSAHMNSYSTLEPLTYEKKQIISEAMKPLLVPLAKIYNK